MNHNKRCIILILSNGYPPILSFAMSLVIDCQHQRVEENFSCPIESNLMFLGVRKGFCGIPLKIEIQVDIPEQF
jgi:hypothetical protein